MSVKCKNLSGFTCEKNKHFSDWMVDCGLLPFWSVEVSKITRGPITVYSVSRVHKKINPVRHLLIVPVRGSPQSLEKNGRPSSNLLLSRGRPRRGVPHGNHLWTEGRDGD